MLVGQGDPERLARAGRNLLDSAGRCFRVDLDLRPEGRDGPLVRSLASYEAYWERWAQPWERQALLKAVPVSGDRELGHAWAAAAARVVWDAPFGADELRHVRSLKVRAEAEAQRRGGADRDVKRGPGGIRDVEFAAQLLQLVHGRVDAELRVPGTLAALTAAPAGRLRRSGRRRRAGRLLPVPAPRRARGAARGRAADARGARGPRPAAPGGPRARLPWVAGRGPDGGVRPGARRPSGTGAHGARARVVPAAARVALRGRSRSASSPPPSASRPSASPTSSAPARRSPSSPAASPGPRG